MNVSLNDCRFKIAKKPVSTPHTQNDNQGFLVNEMARDPKKLGVRAKNVHEIGILTARLSKTAKVTAVTRYTIEVAQAQPSSPISGIKR